MEHLLLLYAFFAIIALSFVAGAIHGRAVAEATLLNELNRYGKEHWPAVICRIYDWVPESEDIQYLT